MWRTNCLFPPQGIDGALRFYHFDLSKAPGEPRHLAVFQSPIQPQRLLDAAGYA